MILDVIKAAAKAKPLSAYRCVSIREVSRPNIIQQHLLRTIVRIYDNTPAFCIHSIQNYLYICNPSFPHGFWRRTNIEPGPETRIRLHDYTLLETQESEKWRLL